ERPTLAPEVPGAGEEHLRIVWVHGQARAARRGVAGVAQDQRPGLAAVVRAVYAAVLAVAPELAGDAGVHQVGALRVHEDARNALRLGQAHVRPALAGVGGLAAALADGDGVASPGLPGTDPDRARLPSI